MKNISLNYREKLEKSMQVTFDSVDVEDGQEVERMWLADLVDGKWVEDYVVVRRDSYEIVTDADGAVFALIENGRMLVNAPNVKHYRIPESVYRIADYAFRGCTEMTDIDVPYSASIYMNPIVGFKEKIAATGISWQSVDYWSSTGNGSTAWSVSIRLDGSYAFAAFNEVDSSDEYYTLGCLAF